MQYGRFGRAPVVCVAILLAFFVFAAPAQAATAKVEAAETIDPLKAATVNIYCTYRLGNKKFSSSGSGVFISERGVILTNAHVAQYFLLPYKDGRLRGSCNVRTGSPAKNQYTAALLYISPTFLENSAGKSTGTGEYDFALLYVTDAKNRDFPTAFPRLAIDTAANLVGLQEVAVTGYSTAKLSYNSVNSKLKAITASTSITSVRDIGRSLTADIITLANSPASAAGMSGGPVTDEEGAVVGLATAISTGKDPVLRAITLSYIDRTIQAESGLPLLYYLLSNFDLQSQKMQSSVASSTIKTIKDSLLKKK